MLEAALEYGRAGIPVFPCHTPALLGGEWRCSCDDWLCDQVGHHPRYMAGDLEHGHKNATTSYPRIERWWRQWPDANIGMAVPDGRLMIDLDGQGAIDWWAERGGPATRTTATGNGQHRW